MTLQQIRLIIAAAVACLVAAPFVLNPFSITLLNYIGIYSLAAIGLALLTGVGGIVSFGQAAFVGVAAYSTAWVTAMNGYSPWLGLLLAVVLTCSIAAILGFVTLRLGGHFLSLSTVAWGLAIAFLFGNIDGLGQHNGISGIPPISIGPIALVESRQIYFLIWAIVVAVLLLCYNLLDSRIGRAMRALRGGNTLVESLGISAFQIKLVTFVIAAFLGALSGWLYAHLGRFVSPGPFDAGMGIEYLMMAMVGGSGSILGGVVGAAIVTLLKNSVQDYLPLIAKGASGQLEIVAFSALFILFLQRARQGIVPFLAGFLPDLKQSRPQAATALPRREQPAPGTLLLKVSDAQRRFGGLVAVNNVSFEVRSGEILGLIGPNGAGKTTMFNLLTGALRANSGEIAFAGRSIARDQQFHIARVRDFPHLPARQAAPAHDAARQRAARHLFAHQNRPARRRPAPEPGGRGQRPLRGAAAARTGRPRRQAVRARRQFAARQSARARDRPRARRRSDAARPRRAGGRPAPPGEAQARRTAAVAARGPSDHPAGRARHGVRDVAGRPHRRARFRLKALRRRAGGDPQRRPRPGSLSRRCRVTQMFSIENVSVAYGKVEAVRNVSLSVEQGQIVTVIGPNGAGKTTLLMAAIGLLKSTGRMVFQGADLARIDVEGRVERGLCLVPEKRELFADMSVADNLLLGTYSLRDRSTTRKSLDDVFDRFPRLKERSKQAAGTLSGGERQMLALGRALMAKPKLLVLDEPSLGLAPLIVREIFRTIASLRSLGVSVLLVEQNARAALETADYGYVLETGEIIQSGPADTLIHDPKLIAAYLGGH